MTKEDSLHLLIRSLNSSEKRLFKVFATKNMQAKDISYLDLFDAVSKMEEYDEHVLKRKLPRSYNFKNLVQHKKYLKDAILKCMRELDENQAQDTLNELMREQVFLAKKNLVKEQWKKLQKASDLALKYELFDQSLVILEAKMTYLIERNFDESLAFFQVYEKEKTDLLLKQNLLSSLNSDKNFIFQLIRKYKRSISQEHLRKAGELIEKYDEASIQSLLSFKVSNLYYTMMSNYMDLQGNLEDTSHYRLALVNLYKQYPWMFENNIKRYLIVYFNYLSSLFRLSRFEEMMKELRNLEKLKLSNENDQGEFFQNHSLYRVLYWMNTGRIEEASKAQEDIKVGVKKFASKINASSLLTLYYNYALVFFCNEKHIDALHWLEQIENIRKDVRVDLKAFARVLSVICHFELGNILLIESLVRSIRRNTDLHDMHKEILSVLLSLSKQNRHDHEQHFRKLLVKVEKSLAFVGKDVIMLWINGSGKSGGIKNAYHNSINS